MKYCISSIVYVCWSIVTGWLIVASPNSCCNANRRDEGTCNVRRSVGRPVLIYNYRNKLNYVLPHSSAADNNLFTSVKYAQNIKRTKPNIILVHDLVLCTVGWVYCSAHCRIPFERLVNNINDRVISILQTYLITYYHY